MYSYDHDVDTLRANLNDVLEPGFFFVNVGANDGVTADPIYPFLTSHRPVGIAVEPVPYVMERLQRNYRDVPGIIFEQVAVSETRRSFWCVDEGSGSIDHVMAEIGSMSRDRVLETISLLRSIEDDIAREPAVPSDAPALVRGPVHEGQPIRSDAEQHVREIMVECVRFPDLMEKHHVERIDFLNIDVEGFDAEVFWSVDWERFRPTVACIELVGLDERDAAPLEEKLHSMGYRWVQTFGLFSVVFVREPGPA